jgi:hypothetical protein
MVPEKILICAQSSFSEFFRDLMKIILDRGGDIGQLEEIKGNEKVCGFSF